MECKQLQMGLEFRFLDKSTLNKIQPEVNMETGSNTAFYSCRQYKFT